MYVGLCATFFPTQQGCWSAFTIIPENWAVPGDTKVSQSKKCKGKSHFIWAVIASDTLPFQLQWQPLSRDVWASVATRVCLKCHSVALGFGWSEEQSGLACHLSSQCAVGGEGQTEYKVPMRWQNLYFTRQRPQKNRRSVLFQRWSFGFEGRTQIEASWVAVWLSLYGASYSLFVCIVGC